MRRYLIASAVAAATCLAVIGTGTLASASTIDVLTTGSAGGPNVAVNNVLTGTLSSGTSATFYESTSGTTGGVCTTGAISETVTSNPAVGSGNAGATVTSQTFSSCTDNINISITSITIDSGYTSAIGSEGTFIPSATATLKGLVNGFLQETCHYTGTSLSGTSVFTNQQFTKSGVSSSTCPSVFYFSATYSAMSDISVSGSPEVFLNS